MTEKTFTEQGRELGKQLERLRVLHEIEGTIADWSYESNVADNVCTVLLNLGCFVAGGDEGTGSKAALDWIRQQPGFEDVTFD